MPKAATKRQTQAADPALPGVLIPPSQTKPNERDAYWIELIDNPEEFRKAISTESFFPLLQELPKALWGSRLSLYLYRLEDEDGVMVKNAEGKPKKIKTLYSPVTDDLIGKTWGGGKYRAILNLDVKTTLRQETFEMDKGEYGPPKVLPGQTVEVNGKPVSIGGAGAASSAQPSEPRTDVAEVIGAIKDANKSAMEIYTDATKASIQMVRDQANATASPAPQKSSISEILELASAIRSLIPPAPDPIATLKTAKELFAPAENSTPQAEPKDPPISEAMTLLESFTGKPFSELIRGRSNPAPAENSWGWIAPLAGVAEKFVLQIPHIMHEARINRDLEFQRAVWLRSAQPGQAVPSNLLPQRTAPAPPAQNTTQSSSTVQTVSAPPNGAQETPDRGHTVQLIVQTICVGFDRHRDTGSDIASVVSVQYGELIEAYGLEKALTDPSEMQRVLSEFPQLGAMLIQRMQHARWKEFEHDWSDYMLDRWGTNENAPIKTSQTGPQPVA